MGVILNSMASMLWLYLLCYIVNAMFEKDRKDLTNLKTLCVKLNMLLQTKIPLLFVKKSNNRSAFAAIISGILSLF